MNEDSIKLLKECSSGCKMAIDSMNQVEEMLKDSALRKVIDIYKQKHTEIEKETAKILASAGKAEKEPGAMASAFSWMTTEMKLMLMKDDRHQAAKLMMDGCNMGIQSICECQNDYQNAEKEAVEVAENLVRTEEEFMKKLKGFI